MPLSLTTTRSASAKVVLVAAVSPSIILISAVVAVTPSNRFSSAAVDVIEVPAICNVVALTSPEEP